MVTATERLYKAFPGHNIPRKPEDPWNIELNPYDVVWYHHGDGHWYPALVTTELPHEKSPRFAGHKVWSGVAIGLSPNEPGKKERIHLCPVLGNAKPDSWYTRLLLQVHGRLPEHEERINLLIHSFKVLVECPLAVNTVDPRLLMRV